LVDRHTSVVAWHTAKRHLTPQLVDRRPSVVAWHTAKNHLMPPLL
jgi:hypothetical protein